MKKTPEQKGKGAFVRMCSSCGKKQRKELMFRIVATPEGADLSDPETITPKGAKTGKSAYICKDPACISKAERSHRPEKLIGCSASRELYDKIKSERL